MDATNTTTEEQLLTAYEEFGYKLVKVDPELKKPGYSKWQLKTIPPDEIREHVAGGGNVGIQVGEVSNWLCAVDLDCPEAIRLAPRFLPETLKSGKQGIASHWIYRSPGAGYLQFKDAGQQSTLIDLKASENGRGHQFVVEPSRHPDKGPYRWTPAFNPALIAELSREDLQERVRLLAVAVLIQRNFPADGGHDYANSLCGYLLRNGMTREDLTHVLGSCWPAGKAQRHNVDGAIKDTADNLQRGNPVKGGRTLEDLAPGLPRALAKALGWERTDNRERSSYHLTDLGNAERFVARHDEDVRYCYPWAKWLVWTGCRWERDDAGRVHRLAKEAVRGIYGEAAAAEDENRRKALAQHATRSEAEAKIRAMLELAKSEVPVSPDELDADPWLLNALNGTVDLRTGELREHQRGDLITKMAPVEYRPDAAAPAWEAFLEHVLPSKELRGFVQRASGYSTTGNTSEQCMFINHGVGANGKSTFQEAIAAALGDYSMRAPTEMLMVKRSGGVPNDVARLKGARFVSAAETEQGRHLAESLVKDLTGTDTITARFMRAEFFDFEPTHKLWLSTNHKPLIRGTDLAIWRRIRLVPWAVTIPPQEQDKQLPSRIQAELPGVLSWIVRGCLDWRREGLAVPDEVRKATGAYRAEMDTLGDFLEDRCVVDPDASAAFNNLWKAYREWCLDTEEKGESKKQFGMSLTERGFLADKGSRGVRIRHGLRLKEDFDPDSGRRSATSVADNPTSATQGNSCKLTENTKGVAHGGSDLHINARESTPRGVNTKTEPRAPHAPREPASFRAKLGESDKKVADYQDDQLAEFFENPPPWFRKQAASCAEQGGPERLVNPLACSTSYAIFGTADRYQEVRSAVEAWLEEVR